MCNLEEVHTPSSLAEVAGFEPTDVAVKVPCLTPWRHLSIGYM